MNARSWSLLAFLPLWLASPASLPGQGQGAATKSSAAANESHLALPMNTGLLSGGAAEQWLDLRMLYLRAQDAQQQTKAQFDVMRLLGDDQAGLRAKLDSLPAADRDRLNAALQSFKSSMGRGNPNQQVLEEQARQLASLFPKLFPNPSGRGGPTPNEDHYRNALLKHGTEGNVGKPTGPESPRPSPHDGPPRKRGPWGAKGGPPESRPAPPPPTREQQTTAQLARRMANWAENSRLGAAFARSPAWHRMMGGLDRYRQGHGGPSLTGGDSFLRRLGLEGGLGKMFSPGTWTFRPDLPRPDLPSLSRLMPALPRGVPAWSAPQTSGLAAAPSATALWRALLWVVLAVVVGLLAWRLLAGKKRARAADDLAGDGRPALGPWPVKPNRVHTRGELIQAFEYLSLLLLGSAARNWHHRQIADNLAAGDVVAERREAAQDLAGLYEAARYAPATQPVSDRDLAAARRHLCHLAGVSAA